MSGRDFYLDTPRLFLRELHAGDYPAVAAILGDIEVMYAWEHAFSGEEIQAWLDKNIARYARDGFSFWAVVEKDSGRLAGVCGLIKEAADGSEYIGLAYIFAQEFWHKGYAYESARAALEHAFFTLNMEEVTAQIRPANAPSRQLAEKLGMAAQKQFVKYYKGKEMPHILYLLEKPMEFPAK